MHIRHLLFLPILGLKAHTVARNIVKLQPGHHTSQSGPLSDGNVTPHLLIRNGDGVRCGPGVGTCPDGKCCSTAGTFSSLLVQPCAQSNRCFQAIVVLPRLIVALQTVSSTSVIATLMKPQRALPSKIYLDHMSVPYHMARTSFARVPDQALLP